MLEVDPCWQGLELARDSLRLQGRMLLHAGPPILRREDLVAPLLNSAVMAVLFEGWAETEDEAEAMIVNSRVEMRPAQDHHVVVPLADVLSPSMWVQRVGNRNASGCAAWSPINGGSGPVMRVGQRSPNVLTHLRWINDELAPVLRSALDPEMSLLDLADQGLALGDDCHGRTAHATAALASSLSKRLPDSPAGTRCRSFLESSPSFFLNLWMAATQCMMRAAEGTNGAAVVTAAGGNGARFGIKLAHAPRQWFTVAAEPPRMPADVDQVRSLGAIGDSAVVDLFGLGAMTSSADRADEPPYAAVLPAAPGLSKRLLLRQHPRFTRSKVLTVLSARAVVATQEAPIISLGVLDKLGSDGRLGGGFYRPPVGLFEGAYDSVQK